MNTTSVDSIVPSPTDLARLYLLDGVKGFGPQKFKLIWEEQLQPRDLLENPDAFPLGGKRGEKLRAGIKKINQEQHEEALARAERQIQAARKYGGHIITYWDRHYPQSVLRSNNPIPVLYVRGNPDVLNTQAVACVGTRGIRKPYDELHRAFAMEAVSEGLAVVSGFALGADTIGHETAWELGGSTICCMPGGLDRPFPPENDLLWEKLLGYSKAAFVTEFAFGMGASSLTLRKRNKLIVAFAAGVMISQSAKDGGAMNAYRFSREQKKPAATFLSDGREDCSGNEQIESKLDRGDEVFTISMTDPATFRTWLRQLSSSI